MSETVDLKKWYVVRAVSGQENKIRDYMESEINRLGFNNLVEDILVPTQKVVQIKQLYYELQHCATQGLKKSPSFAYSSIIACSNSKCHRRYYKRNTSSNK